MLAPRTRTALAVVSRRNYICQSCLRRARKPPLAPTTTRNVQSIRALQTDSNPPPNTDAPFRKALKDATKQKKKEDRAASASYKGPWKEQDVRLQKWELTVGIEIHAELNTARKLFSSAATSINAEPNSHVALFDVAFPGSQPHFQQETLIPALRAALALQCDIQHRSSFDRKHYFYQDQPAGYQITQYYG
jgi:aspartyl-tRNA(Asn)/glutamyl-tRNA(Gln) amidotransferase subunit B